MWEPDAKLYAFLLFVWAFFLVASLATVSPESMYLMTEGELQSLRDISASLKEGSAMLKSEAESWRQTSERLDAELETSLDEMESLRTELGKQKQRSEALESTLISSEQQAAALKTLAAGLTDRAVASMKLSEQLKRDLSQMRLSRNIWRIAAIVSTALAGVGWTMILYYP